jgi:transposase InsO family protein
VIGLNRHRRRIFGCYVILDIFSRYVTGWLIAATEDPTVTKDFFDDAVNGNGATPHTIHADRGGSMRSKPVSELLVNLGVLRSHSRPQVEWQPVFGIAIQKLQNTCPTFPIDSDRWKTPARSATDSS